MKTSRVTLRDIAQHVGLHLSSVSLALRNHPRIPKATRERVVQAARELGYQPDPMLSALALYRERNREQTFHGNLAWIYSPYPNFDWSRSGHYRRYYEGARRRLLEYGYYIEPFKIEAGAASSRRLVSIFRARNITGIMLCPHPTGYQEVTFPWENYSLITFGYSMIRLRTHTVASAHYRNMRRVMQIVRERGYQRPGLIMPAQTDATCDHNVSAAYLIEQQLAGRKRIPPFYDFISNREEVAAWLRKHRIDVVVTVQEYAPWLHQELLANHEGVALVNLSLSQPDDQISGIVEDDESIGTAAADLLVGALHRGERGLPLEPLRVHLEGHWNEGNTLKTRSTV